MNDCGSGTIDDVAARVRGLFVVAVVAALAAIGFGLLGSSQSSPGAAFDLQALGAPQRALPAVHTAAFTATIGAHGYTTGAGRHAVKISAFGTGAWTAHAHGATRRTSFGHETITLAPNAVEQLSTVERRLGTKTWSWDLQGVNLDPRLRADGSVWFGPGVSTHILPVAIFDRSGKNVTPAGLGWSLRHGAHGWRLQLRFDDAKLPLPYVIDPASVTAVTATGTSLAAGAKANWSFGFTTSNSGALAAAGTITVTFPTWTGGTIPATPTVVLLSPASFVTTCTATAATVTTTVTITLASASGQTCALAKNTAATFEITGISNTTTTGAKTISVGTSADGSANASPSPSIVAATSPAATISFAGNTQAAAAITPWTVGFKSSTTNGALVGGSTITAVFNAAFAVTATPTITLDNNFAGCSATGATTAGPTVTVTLSDSGSAGSCSLPASTQASFTISGVTNPAAASYAAAGFTVKTLSDSTAAAAGSGVTIASQTTPSAASVTASNRSAAATGVTYTTSVTPSAVVTGPPPTTGALAAGDTITVTLPAGTTVPASPTITPTGGFTNCGLTSPGSSATVVVTLANSGGTCALAAGTTGTFTISGITNAAAGSYTPTIKTSVDQTAASSASLVLFGAATQVVFTTQPAGATGGSAFTTQPVVTVEDAGGRTVANNSSSVTVAIKAGTGTAGAGLSGTATVSAVNGVATFSGLSIDKTGTSYQLHATDGALTAGDSSAFNVTVGSAAKLAVSQQPAGATGGSPFSTQTKITVQDAGGNTVTTDSSTVTLTIGTNPASGTLSGCGQSETSGVITFSGCKIDKAGTGYTLHATDASLTATDTSAFNVTVGSATQLAYTSDTSSVVSGSTKTLTAVVEDAGGNTVTSDSSTVVVFSQTGGAGSLTGLGTATASAGTASLTVTGNLAGSVTIQAAKQGGGLTTATSTFSVTPGTVSAATSTIGGSPSSITADGSSTTTVTVQAKDAAGNNLTSGGSTIKLTTTDGTFPSSCTTDCTATDNGNGTYSLTLTSSTTAHAVTISGKVGVTAMTNTAGVTFAPGAISAAISTIGASPSSITADGSSTTTLTVQAKDAHGNNLTSGGSTIKLTTTDGTFPSSCTTDCTATDNGNGTYTLTLTSSTTAHAVTISGKVGVTAMTNTASVTFAPGAATQLVFTAQPASATAGSAFGTQPVVKVEDAHGNVVTSGADSSVSITMSVASGGGSLQGTTTVAASGGIATFTNLRIDTSGSHTIGAATTLSITGAVNTTSSSFNVSPAAASRLVVTGSASMTAGGSQTVTVTATDPYGNTDTSFTGNHTLVFSGANPSPGPATSPTVRDRLSTDQTLGANTSLSFTAGQATATAKLYDVETANVAAADATDSLPASTGADRLTVTVNPGAASKLAFTTQPGGTINGGGAFGTQPVVAADDAYGNLATGDASSVTLAITNGTGAAGAALGGTATVAASNGSATFAGLSIDKAGTGYTLTATDGALTSAVSSTFTVNVGPAAALAVSTQPAGATGGSAFGTQPVVDVVDAGGNRVTGDSSSVTVAIKAGTGTGGAALSGTATVSASSGRATFSGLSIDKAGTSYKLHATDGTLTAVDTAAFDVTVGAAAKLAFTTSPSGATGGYAFGTQPVVAVQDAGSNTVTGDSSSLTLSIGTNPSSGTLSGCSPTETSGVFTLAGCKIDKVGNGYTLHATDGSLTAADSASFNVTTGAVSAGASTVSASPTALPADGTTTSTITVTLKDAGGNPVSGKTVTLAQGTGHAAISAASGPSDSSGVVTFTATNTTSENVTFTATDSTDATTITQTAAVSYSSIDANNSTVGASPSSVVADGSTTSTITVTVKDSNNNPVAGKTVTLGQGAGHSTISAASGPSNASGVVTFTVKSTVAEQVTYTATAGGVTLAHTAQVTFTPGAADHVTFTSGTGGVTSGATKTLTVELRDANGNLETGDNSTVVTFAKTSGAGTVTGLGAATASSGVASLTVTGQTVGALSVTASKTGLTSDTSSFSVTVGPADHLTFTSGTANVASGATKALTVEVRDAAGNLETADNSTVVTFAKTAGSGTVTGLGTATASSGVASLTVTGQTAGALTVTASKTGLTSDTSSFSVTVGTADHLTFTSDASSVASGSTKTLTAEIRDANGNLESADNSTVVSFAKTAGSGTVTGLGTATASAGVASLTVTGQTAGALTITASKTGLTSDTTSFSVTVGPADHLTFTSGTGNVASGATKTLTAEIRDAAGNLESADNSTVVSFAKTAGSGTVTGLGTATASSGVATLTVTGQTAGALTVTASKTGLTSDTSSFSVTVGPADHLTYTTDTSSVASGSTKTLTAEIRDAAGNLEAGDNSTVVTFAKTAGSGTVTGLGTATASSGVASLTVTGQTAGALTIAVSKTGLTSDTSSFSVTVGPADHLTFTSGTANVASGATKTLTVEVRDAAGNLESADNSTVVTFAKTAGTGTVTGLGTATASSGVASLTITGHTAGSVTVTASKTGLTNDTSSFSVTPGTADHLTFTSGTANVASGATKALTVEIRDANGNLETTDNSTTVTFAKTAGSGTLTGLGTATASSGVATLIVTGQTAGALTITASKTGLTSDTSSFSVTPGTADHLTFTSPSSDLAAGAARNLTVEIHDANGNLVNDNSTQIALTESGTGTVAGLPSTLTASGGSVARTVTGNTAGAITITAHAAGLTPDATSSFNVLTGAVDAGVSTVVASTATTSTDTGNTNTITVTVEDAFGNGVASAPVTLTQSGGHSAISPSLDAGATGSATANASGVATFTVSDTTVEGVVYSATASGTPITQTAGVTYTVGSPAKLVFGQQPTNVGAGQSIVPAVTVRVLDAHSNLVSTSTAGVTLTIHTNPSGGTLSGGGSTSASGGIATFAGLSIDQVGNGYTLDAASTGLTGATSSAFNVLVAPGVTLSGFSGNVVLDSGNSHRVFFRSGGSGSFVVTATPSGQASYSFPSISGFTGVQGTGATLNTITYTYSGSAAGGTALPVTYNDGSSDSGPTLFDAVDDSTKPTGGSISAPATAATASVALTTTNYADADSGIASNVITRSAGQAPSGGVCPANGYSGSNVVTSPDTGVVSGTCYVYTLTGTDKVGNSDSTASAPVLVDTSAPSDPTFVSISGAGSNQYYTGSGTTIYFAPGADSTNQFTLTASASDPQSGVTYHFPHISGFTETAGAGPGQERYVAANPTTADGGTGTVTATNGVGTASSGGFSFTIVIDGSGPSGGAFTSPASATYSTDGTGTVAWNAFADAGSGLSTLTIRRQLTGLAANACDTANFADDSSFAVTLTTASTSIPPESGLAGGKCFRYVTTATDHLGNVTTRTSAAFLVDTTAPATPTLTTLTTSGANVYASGSTVYFKPGADNTNTITATAATTGDSETGVKPASWAFAAVPGFTAAAPAGNATESYTASSPTAVQGGAGSATVQDNAGLTSAAGAAFTVMPDASAPSGGGFSGVPQYSGDGNVSFSMTTFGDAGSGIATQSVQRQYAAPTGSTCPAGGWTNDGTPVAPAASFTASVLSNGTCYRWLYDASDNVGNAATTVVGGPTLVDTSGPSAPSVAFDSLTNVYANGTTIYYDPGTGGSFRVTATSTASASGIGSYTFNESSLLSHGFHRSGSGNQAVLTFGVGATDALGTVTATSNSGITSTATNFSLVGDAAGPAAPTLACAPASCTSNSNVTITLTDNGDGGGSGVKEIRYTTDGSDPNASSALYTGPFAVPASGLVKAAAIDNLGHVGGISSQPVTVDATPPHPTSTDVSGTSMNIHFDKLLVPSEIPANGAFAVGVTANGSTVADAVTNVAISGATVTLTLATPVTNAQTASVTYTQPGTNQLQDSFANYVTGFTQTATLDVTAPSVLAAAASGTTFSLQFDEPLNPAALPATSAFAVTMTAGGSPSANAVTGVAISGSTLTLTLGTAVAGFQTAAVVYTQPGANPLSDLAGNDTGGFTKTVTLDTTPPHATAAEVNGSTLTLHFDEALAGPAPAGSAFTVSLGGLSTSVTGVSLSGSDVTLTLAAAAVGGQSVSLTYIQPASNKLQDAAANATPGFTIAPTNLTSGGSGVVPTFVSATPADGSTQASLSGPVVLSANEYVAWSNLSLGWVAAAGGSGTTQPLSGGTSQTLSLPVSASSPGLYTISGTISDGVTTTTFVTHFTVWNVASGDVPQPTAKTALPGASGSLTTADQKETVSWPASAVPTSPGDGLIVEMAPQSPSSMPPPSGTAWSAGGVPVDITVHTMLANAAVHTFSDPLVITFPNATPTDVPIVSSDGGATWRFVSPCDAPGVFPAGATDCFAFSSGVLTVWTTHLTLFALTSDHQPPTAPQKLGLSVYGGQVVLRWEPATDNSGRIASYTIFVDGQPVKTLGGDTFEYYAGPAVTGDTHVYRVQATDGSGNPGPFSDAYTGVPDLHGLSLQQARDVLASRGFTVGTIGSAGSGGGVASQNPAAPAYAAVGSAIDFSLSTVVRTPLALHVVGTKRLNLMTRHYTAVRVQLNMSAELDARLTAGGRAVAKWSRALKAGTWILRYELPAGLAPGGYTLDVTATTSNERRASTMRLEIQHGRVVLGGKVHVLVVGDGSPRDTLAVRVPKTKATVTVTPDTKVWDTTYWSRNVAVVVVDVDQQGLAIVHNLHTVFPSVRIVAVTKSPGKVVQARRFGASAVVLAGPATSQLVSATVSALLGRV